MEIPETDNLLAKYRAETEARLRQYEARVEERDRLRKAPFTSCTVRTRSILIANRHGCLRKIFTEAI